MAVLGNRGRQNIKEMTMAEYSRKKLLAYADSLKELANCLVEEEEHKEADADMPNLQEQAGDVDMPYTMKRRQVMDHYQARERQQALCEHVKELSKTLSKMAAEAFSYRPFPERLRRRVVMALRTEKIRVRDLYYLEDAHYSIGVRMSSEAQGGHGAPEIADMLSVLLDKRLLPAITSPVWVDKEEKLYVFLEEPAFLVVPGYAKAVKENESVSGDNYALIDTASGELCALLADGMGSGEIAGRDSEKVLELMEKLLEAGTDQDAAIQLLNNDLAVSVGQNMSTLDMCTMDLYSGMCRFRKAGAATTFLKSNSYVEQIQITSLPLGIFQERENQVVVREIIENDYIIMVTDGIIDALEDGYEEVLQRYIEDIPNVSPGEMAQRILQFALHISGGRVADDMTVLVLGVYANG